jgi:hypothetical protein
MRALMFVTTLTTDTKTIASPSWGDVEREVGALDGRTQTLVMLAPAPPKGAPEGDHQMAIGGGTDGHFIVYATDDNLSFANLIDPEKRAADRKVRMLIGGQEGEYCEAQLVSRELALRAARRYLDDGRCAPDLTWTRGLGGAD